MAGVVRWDERSGRGGCRGGAAMGTPGKLPRCGRGANIALFAPDRGADACPQRPGDDTTRKTEMKAAKPLNLAVTPTEAVKAEAAARPVRKSSKLNDVCYDIRGPVLTRARQMEDE